MSIASAGALLTTVCLLATACSDDGRSSQPPPTSVPATTTTTTVRVGSVGCEGKRAAPGVSDRTIRSDGVERQYQLTIPESYDGRSPLPVVFALHGLTVSHLVAAGIAGFGDVTDRYDFIGVAPSGRLNGQSPFWEAAPVADNQDVGFIDDLLDRLERDLCIDGARVYASGMSNGAQMSSVLACMLADRFAAVAPVAGVEWYEKCDGRSMPVIAFHGVDDPIVLYDGGGLNAQRIADVNLWRGDPPEALPPHRGVDAALTMWATHNRCDPEPVTERISPEVRKRTWQNCEAETVLYAVDGGGHSWPGRPVPGSKRSSATRRPTSTRPS